jgi:hypothetical protein
LGLILIICTTNITHIVGSEVLTAVVMKRRVVR